MASVVRWGQSAYETDADVALEKAGAEALGLSWVGYPESDVPPPLSDCKVLVVTSRVRVDRSVLEGFTGSLVLTTTSGTDHLDLSAAAARNVALARCPMARRDPVVEQSLACLVGLMRRFDALHEASSEGRWARGDLPELAPRGLSEARVVVVGLGVIGSRMAELLAAFGADVVGVDPAGVPAGIEAASLDEALPGADAVTLHCALDDSTRGLMSRERLARLPAHAVVVNTARGPLIDPFAAAEAVHAGQLGGVALDVYPYEPCQQLRDLAGPQVWLTPHSAGFTRSLGRRVASEVVATLQAWVSGVPLPHPVGR